MEDREGIAADIAAKAERPLGPPTRNDIIVAIVVVLIAGFFFVRWVIRLTHRDDMYFLAVANPGTSSLEIAENVTGKHFTVAAGDDITFVMMEQPQDKANVEREFTITANGETKTFRSAVVPTGTVVIDPTGQSCFTVVDYSRRYHPEGQAPTGGRPSSELDVLDEIRHKELFTLEPGRLYVPFGMPMPEIAYNKKSERLEVVRMLRTPCELRSTEHGLYEYLMSH